MQRFNLPSPSSLPLFLKPSSAQLRLLTNYFFAEFPTIDITCGNSACNKRGQFTACSKCRMVRYCSQECQKADWKASHKQLCSVSQSHFHATFVYASFIFFYFFLFLFLFFYLFFQYVNRYCKLQIVHNVQRAFSQIVQQQIFTFTPISIRW